MLTSFPPCYLYLEFNDDENLQAIFASYNAYVQAYLDAINNLWLPIYTKLPTGASLLTFQQDGTYDSSLNNSIPYDVGGPTSVGTTTVVGLLAWVLTGLYGILRPTLGALVSSTSTNSLYNRNQYNRRQYNQFSLTKTYNYSVATDDLYKRVATWTLYKGDGWTFTARWLKRRVVRFLTGTNGIDPGVQETYGVSVVFNANYQITISVNHLYPGASFITALSELIASGALAVPIPYVCTVVTV